MAAPCAVCGGKKQNSVHLRAAGHPQYHPYSDKSPVGIQPMSEGRREYQRSAEHREAYRRAFEGDKCLVGLAGGDSIPPCYGDLTPHHIAPRGQFGGQEAAEKYPVILACSFHNGWLQDNEKGRAWGYRNTFVRDGIEYPFLMRAPRKAREVEEVEIDL